MTFKSFLENHKLQFLRDIGRSHGHIPNWIRELARSSHIDNILSQVQGAKLIGRGSLGIAWLRPEGTIVRLGPTIKRHAVPEILQPISSQNYGNVSLEVMPYAPSDKVSWRDVYTMALNLLNKGLYFYDSKVENMGRTKDGRLFIVDPDAVKPLQPGLYDYLKAEFENKLNNLAS